MPFNLKGVVYGGKILNKRLWKNHCKINEGTGAQHITGLFTLRRQ
jgi:hypothetical protein